MPRRSQSCSKRPSDETDWSGERAHHNRPMSSHRPTFLALSCALALGLPAASWAAPECSTDAVTKAKKLFDFHVDNDDRASVDPKVVELPSIRNPANKRQKFIVLEVWGGVYKGSYRMRLIYYRGADTGCVLMGQEILEFASL